MSKPNTETYTQRGIVIKTGEGEYLGKSELSMSQYIPTTLDKATIFDLTERYNIKWAAREWSSDPKDVSFEMVERKVTITTDSKVLYNVKNIGF